MRARVNERCDIRARGQTPPDKKNERSRHLKRATRRRVNEEISERQSREFVSCSPNRNHSPPPARIAPAQRAAHEPAGTLRRHAACSPAACLHTAARSALRAGVPPSVITNSNPQHAPRILPQKSGAMRVEGNHAHPSLARGCPCRQSSLARLRSPMCLRAAVVEPGGLRPGAAAGATQRPRCARPGRHRCERSSHGARRVGLPFGPAHATSAVLPRVRSAGGACLRSRRSRVWRSARSPPQPRLAPLAPRRVRLRLTPSPRSRRRAILPLHSPSPRAWRRAESAAILPLHPPCPRHVARRSPPAWNGSRYSRR